MENIVTKEVCEQKHKMEEERFCRDRADIEKLDRIISETHDLNIKFAGMIEADKKKIDDIDIRVRCMEEKPAKRWENIVGQIIQLLITAIFGAVIGSAIVGKVM